MVEGSATQKLSSEEIFQEVSDILKNKYGATFTKMIGKGAYGNVILFG